MLQFRFLHQQRLIGAQRALLRQLNLCIVMRSMRALFVDVKHIMSPSITIV